MARKLNDESVRGWLKGHTGWRRRGRALVKQFEFPSFRDAIVFVNRVATIADQANHHPDIDIRYDKVKVTLTTHDAGGITESDLQVGDQIDFATSNR